MTNKRMTLRGFLETSPYLPRGLRFAEARQKRLEEGQEIWLTSLQQEVLQNPVFWDPDRNIVIRGATSSGKTLTAELAALRQITDPDITENRVIFLVPLRALVTAQCRQLQEDFQNIRKSDGSELKIYESSADYQDHDIQILNNDYDIAVIVYEKFFSMLNNQGQMLNSCGLLVVDELQMLSMPERGGKMEFSMMKVLELQQLYLQQIRLIGLTTSESGVNGLCSWLDAEMLGNNNRPVGLEQFVVSCNSNSLGHWLRKDIPGENGSPFYGENEEPPTEGVLDHLDRFAGGNQPEDRKDRCLLALLSTWMSRDATTGEGDGAGKPARPVKILLFVNTKASASRLARTITEKFPLFTVPPCGNQKRRETLYAELQSALEEYDDETDVQALGKWLPRGIVFHHSGLPAAVREAIEDDFRDANGTIQLIICTETLMIGMNLPADVVILYDNTVYHGLPYPEALTTQEYKNFIGRAGRLGMGTVGTSYLFTERARRDFQTYTSDNIIEIRSSFGDSDVKSAAPYFLGWIGSNSDVLTRIRKGLRQSFFRHGHKEDDAEADAITKALEGVSVTDSQGFRLSLIQDGQLSNLGYNLSSYALSLSTCTDLLRYMIERQKDLKQECLQVTARTDSTGKNTEWLPSRPLFELLYKICRCQEVNKNPALHGYNAKDMRKLRTLDERVKAYLQKLYPQSGETAVPVAADNRTPAQIAQCDFVAEPVELQALSRAAIMAMWMAGCSMNDIRRTLQFNLGIATSDVERLAEVVAYLMEALSKSESCLALSALSETDVSFMRGLSVSMKYGVPHELVPLASTRTRKVTRRMLLDIAREAHAVHKKPLDYLRASTNPRYKSLQQALRERDSIEYYLQQIENKSLEISDRLRPLLDPLMDLDSQHQLGTSVCAEALSTFFSKLSALASDSPSLSKWKVKAADYGSSAQQLTFYLGGGRICNLNLQILDSQTSAGNGLAGTIQSFLHKADEDALLYCVPTRSITVLYSANPNTEASFPEDHLVISSEMLGILLLDCLLVDSPDPIELIYHILADLKGVFLSNGPGYFSSYQQLTSLVHGYALPRTAAENVNSHPQLFYYPGIFAPEPNQLYGEVAWGTTDAGTELITFFHPAMCCSRAARFLVSRSKVVLARAEDQPLAKSFQPGLLLNPGSEDMDEVLQQTVESIRQPARTYSYDVGLSFRGMYQSQMTALKSALASRGLQVLCMNTDDFEAQMQGSELTAALTKAYSSCRHIIVCDTVDYDQSLYTGLVEYNVILDKTSYALEHGKEIPIHLIQMPDTAPSQTLQNCFRRFVYYTYSDAGLDALAQELASVISSC